MGTKNETQHQFSAFELYYSMTPNRSLRQTAKQLGTSLARVGAWSSSFKWQDRSLKRDREIADRIVKANNDAIVNTAQDYRELLKKRVVEMGKKIDKLAGLFDAAGDELKAETVRDLRDIASAMQGMYEKEQSAIKLDLQIAGGSVADGATTINIITAVPRPQPDLIDMPMPLTGETVKSVTDKPALTAEPVFTDVLCCKFCGRALKDTEEFCSANCRTMFQDADQ